MSSYLYALLIACVLFIAHVLGMEHNIYLHWNPYDIFMHILGGVAIATFLYPLAGKIAFTKKHRFWILMLGVLLAGILWEVIEGVYGIAGHPVGVKLYWIDTIKDIIDDMLGGFIVAMLWRFRS